MALKQFDLVIIGGGSGGISMASRMLKHIPQGRIAIIEPSENHYYQPFWTLIGAGISRKEVTRKPMSSVIPEGVEWIKSSVSQIRPKENIVSTSTMGDIAYKYLIVASGLKLDWGKIDGLPETLGKNGVHSIYTYEGAELTATALKEMKSGKALFYMPPVPIKCAGAPQKIMYLAEEMFCNQGVRQNIQIHFASNGAAIFGVAHYHQVLNQVLKRKNIQTHFLHRLKKVDGAKRLVVFDLVDATGNLVGKEESIAFDFLHVVPPQSAHEFLTQSGLAHTEGPQKGWLKVDFFTMQHLDYPNIFGIGDVTGVPNSKTGAAIRMQAPVVEKNLLAAMKGIDVKTAPVAKYDGYSSCPIVTSFGTVVLAEFGYDSKLMPTFPIESVRERWIYWVLKRWLLPVIYWHGMLKGRM